MIFRAAKPSSCTVCSAASVAFVEAAAAQAIPCSLAASPTQLRPVRLAAEHAGGALAKGQAVKQIGNCAPERGAPPAIESTALLTSHGCAPSAGGPRLGGAAA